MTKICQQSLLNVCYGSRATTVVSSALWSCWPFTYEITHCNLNVFIWLFMTLNISLSVCVWFGDFLWCKLPGHSFCLLFYYCCFLFLVNLYEFLVYYILTFCKCYTCKTSFLVHLLCIDFVQRYCHWIESLKTDFIKFISSSLTAWFIFLFFVICWP